MQTLSASCTLKENRRVLCSCLILLSVLWPKVYSSQCLPSTLPHGIGIVGSCSFGLQDFCTVACKYDGVTKWETQVRCQKHGKWSPLPTCRHKLHARSLKSVGCDERLQPNCKKAKCRTLIFSSNSIYSGKCMSKPAGGVCFLSCKGGGKFIGGKNYIKCSKSGRWTKPKKCFCPDFIAPRGYVLKENCSEKLPGDTCQIACRNGADLESKQYITCNDSTHWTDLPLCESSYCPLPLLSKKLKIENCNRKKSGETCKLYCENGGILSSKGEIHCNAKGLWSSFPECTCSKPILPPSMESQDSCEGKRLGQRCYISCKSATLDIITKYFIQCIMEPQKMWSTLPNCTCSYPTHLNPHVKLQTNCRNLSYFPLGETCNVYCSNRGKIFNGTRISCLASGNWSPSPFCACAPPYGLSFNLSNCSETLPGTRCKISCLEGVAEKKQLLCDRFYNWEALPVCKVPCRDVTFHRDLVFRNCTNLMTEDICRVECKNNARIIGANSLTCIEHSRYKWRGVKPVCVCMPPTLTKQHVLKDNCMYKRRGQHCLIGCKNIGAPDGYSTCVMEKDHMWTPLPDCK